ncbi:hypothetical protein RDV64_01610 [Acuticoccus sp. MNP-M23]|uniref:hypothetical protein n=1 Tax=Acuticoccus sp. MNP-M23 TaxID=3072793 RepID=UPI0028156502|nr:hypothetical protein [Acuticoccus sp. MNP-M23]WMS43129.1 hypothetical protein RDV64_01610 [Acuticoccus sp. MNP-M23]
MTITREEAYARVDAALEAVEERIVLEAEEMVELQGGLPDEARAIGEEQREAIADLREAMRDAVDAAWREMVASH